MLKRVSVIALIFGLIFLCSCSSDENLPNKYLEDGVAISGYDLTCYFTEGKAKKGKSTISYELDSVNYYFASEEGKTLFIENPNKYLPAYGGWCGYAIAERSKKMPPNPEQWIIQDDRLILFFDNIITKLKGGLLNKWKEDPKEFEKKADKNWVIMSKENDSN